MKKIIDRLNENNGSTHKMDVLRSEANNEILKRVLKMTYCKVTYTYGISMKNITYVPDSAPQKASLEFALDHIEANLVTGNVTGNAANDFLTSILEMLTVDDAKIVEGIINRDLRINMGRSNINKVFSDLIIKPVYCRCDIFTTDKEEKDSEGNVVLDKKGQPKIKKGTASKITLTVDEYMREHNLTEEDLARPEIKAEIDKLEPRAIVQLKADGTYREFSTFNNESSTISRSGEAYSYPAIEAALSTSEDGYMTGELTVRLDDALLSEILPKLLKLDAKNGTDNAEEISQEYRKHQQEGRVYILPRSIGNGLINSDDIPYDNLVYEVWDFISPEDYALAGNLKNVKYACSEKIKQIKADLEEGKISKEEFKNLTKQQKIQNVKTIEEATPKVKYIDRFNKLIEVVAGIDNDKIQVIDHLFVRTLKEATDYTSKQMKLGLEGAILKDFDGIFKDGTADWQLKMKISFSIDVRIVGFIEGKPGTKRTETFGSLIYETDDKMIRGSVSGLSDDQLADFHSRRVEITSLVMEIEGNDLTKGRSNDYYAVSHPRFTELRNDKTYTDDLERAFLMLEGAKEFTDAK